MSNRDFMVAPWPDDAGPMSSPTRGGTLRWGDLVGSHAKPTRGGTLRGLVVHELRCVDACAAPRADEAADTLASPIELLRAMNDAVTVCDVPYRDTLPDLGLDRGEELRGPPTSRSPT
ncbi:MAG TPA: hypothetical protein VGM56_00960 [Byssovorax sp.]|jgi:hypothetical protein